MPAQTLSTLIAGTNYKKRYQIEATRDSETLYLDTDQRVNSRNGGKTLRKRYLFDIG